MIKNFTKPESIGFQEYSLLEDKKKTVYMLLKVVLIVGGLGIASSIIEYIKFGQHYAWITSLFIYLILVLLFFFRKKLSLNLLSASIIIFGYLIGTVNLFSAAYYGAVLVVYLCVGVICTFLLGVRAGIAFLFLNLITLAIAVYLFTFGHLEVDNSFKESYKDPLTWITVIISCTALIAIAGLGMQRLLIKLQNSYTSLELQTRKLLISNTELEETKISLQSTVEKRNSEIEQKNKKLEVSNTELKSLNEELKRFNSLFDGREDRINELEKKVEQYEKKLKVLKTKK